MHRLVIIVLAIILGIVSRPAEAQKKAAGARGPYTVAASERGFVLVDQRTGRTWILEGSAEGDTGPVWIPIDRIDDPEEGEHWRREKQSLVQEQRERAERARAERTERERHERFEPPRIEQRPRILPQPRDAENTERRFEARRQASEQHLQARRRFLEALETQRERLQDQFGEDHPTVQSMRRQIERLEDELKSRPAERETVDEEANPALGQLLLEEQSLLKKYEPEHPRVKSIRRRIDMTRKRLSERHQDEDETPFNREGRDRDDDADDDDAESRREGDESAERLSDLAPLLIEEELLLQTHGPEHPKVREVRTKIKTLKSLQTDEDIQRKLKERDRNLQREEEQAKRDRQAALRKAVLAKRKAIEEKFAELKEKHGEDAPELEAARKALGQVQEALDDLGVSDE